MKKAIVYGTAVLALSAAPLFAQQPSAGGQASRPGSSGATTSTQGGSTGTQGGSGSQAGTSGQTGSATRSGAGASSQAASQSNADHQFVMEAAQGGMAEVELGQLASEKAQSSDVKQFAQRMVTDHGKANDELKTLAQSKNITLPTDVGAKHKATKDKLSKMSGAAFDRAYMQEMVTDHRKDVSEFEKESKSGKDPDVKAFAAKTLPTLHEHMQMAESASRSAVGTSGTKSGSDTTKSPTGSTGTAAPGGAGSGTTRTPGGGGTSSTPSGGSTSSPGSATGSSSPR
jgi:putative membrane protein